MTYHSNLLYLTEGGGVLGIFVVVLLVVAVMLGIFLIIRSIVLWYWKVDVIVRNQQEQTALLRNQNQLIEHQNTILKEGFSKMANTSNL